MPGIITHLAFAQKYSKKNSVEDFDRFILGSIFPDVRYFANVGRELTHAKIPVGMNFPGLGSFESGWKLHLYLDEHWNELMKNSIFFECCKDEPFIASAAAKVIEDEIDSKRLNEPEKYQKIFRNQQLGSILGIPADKIRLYYSASADYLETRNFKALLQHFLDEELITKIAKKIEEMRRDEELIDFLSAALDKL